MVGGDPALCRHGIIDLDPETLNHVEGTWHGQPVVFDGDGRVLRGVVLIGLSTVLKTED